MNRVNAELMELLHDNELEIEETRGLAKKVGELESRLQEFDKYVLEGRLFPLESRVAALEHKK